MRRHTSPSEREGAISIAPAAGAGQSGPARRRGTPTFRTARGDRVMKKQVSAKRKLWLSRESIRLLETAHTLGRVRGVGRGAGGQRQLGGVGVPAGWGGVVDPQGDRLQVGNLEAGGRRHG